MIRIDEGRVDLRLLRFPVLEKFLRHLGEQRIGQHILVLLLPLLLLIVGQFTGVLLMNVWLLLGLGGVCAVLAWILLQKSMGRFTYEKLLP